MVLLPGSAQEREMEFEVTLVVARPVGAAGTVSADCVLLSLLLPLALTALNLKSYFLPAVKPDTV